MFFNKMLPYPVALDEGEPKVKLPCMALVACLLSAGMAEPIPEDIRPWCLVAGFVAMWLMGIGILVSRARR